MAKRNWKPIFKNSVTLVISTLLSLIILELGVRLFIPQDKKITWIEMHERGFVMNQHGGSAFHEFEERRVDYDFTAYRTRGDQNTTIDSAASNILILGDSFTFGLLLNEEDTYISHLQNW